MTLVSYWPLDEDSGSTATDIRGSNDGSIEGPSLGATGVLGTTSYSFNNSNNDRIVVSDSTDLDVDNITVSFWANKIDTGSSSGVFEKNLQYEAVFRDDLSTGVLEFVITIGGSNFEVSTTIDEPENTWIHYCMTYDGNEMRIYRNGSLNNNNTTPSGSLDSSSNSLLIGQVGQSSYYGGELDDIRLYNRALTRQEVQYLYEVSQRGKFTTSVKP